MSHSSKIASLDKVELLEILRLCLAGMQTGCNENYLPLKTWQKRYTIRSMAAGPCFPAIAASKGILGPVV